MQTSAPAKLILCGEHAVVYGCPALALPLADVRATALVTAGQHGEGLRLVAPDLNEAWSAHEQSANPLSELALEVAAQLGLGQADLTITLRSQIPVASGMGSGAAIATALVRALAMYAGQTWDADTIAALVYASEQRFHGTPSGIDNTVVAHERAIWFERRSPKPLIEPIAIGAPFTLVVGDTGVRSATHLPVGAVRTAWQADPARYEALFAAVATLVGQARSALAQGDHATLGTLLNQNQALLEQIGVSSLELERLVHAARAAGALGAKLSGAGWGGIMLALAPPAAAPTIAAALREAGAVRVLTTEVVP
ncbi:mevalonate kinase [Candidatus Viridilinea mediisalina]|uniref:Mevalonate kinase n=1 Tax=Candidatus Viridilinea mediisalina TaxID=2024553 RepID=A0A2A6RJN0_9CHLR|nr:mevalonate kinase [Candidatus Viridilinea mediisalina]PDW03095.1 mevalonate kinase [Candidatus Viridilinea mediisalina]